MNISLHKQIHHKFWEDMQWNLLKPFHKSIYFYTFHKCASTLFSDYILGNVGFLRHMDYDKEIFNGGQVDNIAFKKYGYVYGPIRISTYIKSPTYNVLIAPTVKRDFVRNKTSICMVRDPRDILISAYYSDGYSHVLSPVETIRQHQQAARNEIRSKTIDQYVIDDAEQLLSNFETMNEVISASKRNTLLKFEDMIDSWDQFAISLTNFFSIKQEVLEHAREITRPMHTENKELHRRSGKTRQFKNKLKPETLAVLNEIFKDVLEQYQYPIN